MKKSFFDKLFAKVSGENSACVCDRFYARLDKDLHSDHKDKQKKNEAKD